MTSEPRVWVRPDGTLYVRDPHGCYGADVTWLAADDPAPEGAVPLVAAPKVDGDDPRVDRLRVGRKVGRTIYAQMGDEPSDDDPLVGLMDTERLAGTVVDAVNGSARHTLQQLREAYERGLANAAPAQPREAPDTQRVAPTRDALVDDEDDEQPHSWTELADEFKGTAQGAEEHSRRQEKATGRADLYALGRASGRSEAEARIRFMAGRLGSSADTQAIVARLATAAGVSPDSEDPVGAIEAAIRAGRESEVVEWAVAEKLPVGSLVVACDDDGAPLPGKIGVPLPKHSGLAYGDYRVLYRAPTPAPAPLKLGDVVTGTRAVSAPVGTTLGAKSAAGAAVHTVNGWSVTGMGREQDHEGHVRANEWVVLALPDGGEA